MKEKFIVSIDLGATNLKLAILNQQYKIIAKKTLTTQTLGSFPELINSIVASVKKLIKACQLNKKDILGLGLGVPGPVDINKGIIHFLPNIPGCKNIRLGHILNRKLGLPVYIDNDANLFTLGEFYLGAGKGFKNVIGITLGTGVGGGIILAGRLYRGKKFVAGEIGHMPVVMRGVRCNCGAQGCLEAYIGNQKILSQAKRVFKKPIGLKALSQLAARGNQQAIKIWQTVGYFLGFALSGIVNLLNPDAIIIGGGVANGGKPLFARIKKTILENAMPVQARYVRVLKSKFGANAALIGAAILVKNKG